MTTPIKPTTEVATNKEKPMEYVPFGGTVPIKINIAIVRRLICVPTKSGKTCSDDDAIKFMMMCHARLLNPFEGDAFMLGYDTQDGPKFSLITAHQAFLKRAERNTHYDGMKSGIIIIRDTKEMDLEGDFHRNDDTILGGWATVFFKERSHPMHKRVRLGRFQKNSPIWREDPGGMICKCAEADALRSSFPTMLGGLYLKEELDHEQPRQINAPLFGNPEPVVQPEDKKKSKDPVGEVTSMCIEALITEDQLIQFMIGIGLADDKIKTIEEAHAANDASLQTVINDWEEYSRRIKQENE